ncbi:MAG: hypothetical protein GTO63_20255 [Anaerolineae bacterium]|nr:hypothetical protein [Anaerolineae bacterium]NIQ80080.1 hypothetical protein [Anaerolineae bacterium]
MDIIPDLVDEANRTGITLFQRVQPMPQEPTVLQGVAKLFRDFLRKLAMAIGIEDVPPAVEAALMGQGAAVYVGTIRLMLNQTYNGTWESYVKDTYGSLDTAIFMVNLTKQVDQIIFNLYEILTGTEADFEFYYDEYDKLALDLEVLRDGLVEWGLGYDLTLDLGTFLAGTVHGRVTDQHTEKGIAGVAVTALSENRDNAPSTATDEDGYYTLRLPRGEWDIVLEKGGYKAVRSDTYVTPFSESQNNVVMESEELYTESGLASAAQWAVALFIVLIAVLGVSHLYRRKHAPPTKAKSQEGCK